MILIWVFPIPYAGTVPARHHQPPWDFGFPLGC